MGNLMWPYIYGHHIQGLMEVMRYSASNTVKQWKMQQNNVRFLPGPVTFPMLTQILLHWRTGWFWEIQSQLLDSLQLDDVIHGVCTLIPIFCHSSTSWYYFWMHRQSKKGEALERGYQDEPCYVNNGIIQPLVWFNQKLLSGMDTTKCALNGLLSLFLRPWCDYTSKRP